MPLSHFKARLLSGLLLCFGTSAALAQTSPTPLSFNGPALTENFNTLSSTATNATPSSTLPAGFGLAESGSGADSSYVAGTGSDNQGNSYSFGTAGSSERALGTLQSSSVVPAFGVLIRNDTAQTLTQFTVSYQGEQYRLGAVRAAGVADRLDFQFSTSATTLGATTGFSDADALDFTSPITTGTTGAVYAATPVSATVTGISVAPGATLILRFNDFNVASSDDGLAIDDFSFSASGADTGATPTPSGTPAPTASPTATATPAPTAPPLPSSPTAGAIISEYRLSGPGGASDEFIELYNQSNTSLDLTGWSVVGGAVTVPIPSNKVIAPYGHLLLTGSQYSLANYGGTGAAAGDVTYAGDIAFGATLTLRNGTGSAVDVVSSSGLPSPTSSSSNYSYVRRMDGAGGAALDTDSDVNDFNLVDVASTVGPNNTTGVSSGLLRLGAPGPQNLASPIAANQFIQFAQTTMIRTGSGNSGTIAVRATITNRAGSGRTFTGFRFRIVGLTAGTTATGNTAPADLRLISSTVSGSNVLPLLLQTPPNQPNGGGLNASVSLAALPGGGLTQGQTVPVEFLFNVIQKGTYRFLLNAEPITADGSGSTLPDDDNMLLGNPSAAIDVASSTDKENLLVRHPGESIGYQKSIGGPRWVSWHLDSNDIGSSGRTDNFRADMALPADCRITDGDYNGSGFDRGHQCPSGDRTASVALNDDTFFMSNMLPQTAALNQKVWATLEDYCRTQVSAGNECYIMSGGVGSNGTIASGKVNVPGSCWKVVVILPKGSNDISRISKSTRVISVLMPNTTTVTGNYSNYYTTVDAIESATGLDLLSNLPDDVENYLEASTTNR